MTPKEYAIKLYNRFNKIKHSVSTHVQKKRTIECCLITVEEIISTIEFMAESEELDKLPFFYEVKNEIERL